MDKIKAFKFGNEFVSITFEREDGSERVYVVKVSDVADIAKALAFFHPESVKDIRNG